MSYPWIRANEIGEYVYCRRAWWLKRVRGVASTHVTEMQAGTAYHQRHGRLVERSVWARRLAYTLLFFAVAVFVFELLAG